MGGDSFVFVMVCCVVVSVIGVVVTICVGV